MKIFGFVQKVFFIGLTILSNLRNVNSLNAIPLSCISMKNQECKTRPQVINNNRDEPVLFLFSIETSKCSSSCNNINYLYANICVPNIIVNENCKCRKKLVHELVDECTETIEEVKLAKITLAENENSYKCSSCTVYIVLMIVVFTIFTGITTYFVYYNWSLIKNNVSCIKFGIHKETKIW